MTPFLLQTAKYITDHWQGDLSQVTVVLPSRRAAVFLRHHLASLLSKTIWAPSILSIEDFIFLKSEYQSADPIELLFELYDVHCNIDGDRAKSADEFFPVGEVMLADFDEVDQHLVDPHNLFEYLHEARAIDLWNPDGAALTEFQTNYLTFYASLGRYYDELSARMKQKGRIWQGLASRMLSAKLNSDEPPEHLGPTILAGFNAFTPAEEAIAASLHHHHDAVILFDTDQWYMDNPEQEAGLFLRRYRTKREPAPVDQIDNHFGNEPKTITMIGSPLHVSQVKQAGHLLASAPFTLESGWQSRTAVVLADESLLMPLLNSIPPSVGKFNVTMGIPLNLTPAGSLLELWFDLLANQRPDSLPTEPVYYLNDLYRVAFHPLMVSAFDELKRNVTTLTTANRSFITATQMWQLLFGPQETAVPNLSAPMNALDLLQIVIAQITEKTESYSPGDLSFISAITLTDVLVRVKHYLADHQAGLTFNMLRRLMSRLTSSTRIPFAGEPLTGIQVMGMLETRALDFENIILIGINDDILPGSGHTPSFIPGDIKTDTFGMAGFREKTAVMAYHFYRLMQRTKCAYLIYNNIPGNLGKGEPSRFLLQMKHEFANQFPNIVIEERSVFRFPDVNAAREINIEKTPEIMTKLREAAKNGFSPTSLSQLVECQLKFFLHRIEGIVEPREATVAIGNDLFGNAVHHVAEQIYKPLLNTELTAQSLAIGANTITALLSEWFKHNMPDVDYKTGNNYLVFQVAVDYLINFFKKETAMAAAGRIIPLQLETPLERWISLDMGSSTESILFKGRADRIDLRDEQQVVIDYKTGTVDPRSVSVADFETLIVNPKQSKALQLMTYAWLAANYEGLNPPFNCAIWPMRAPSKALIYLNFPSGEGGRNRFAAADILVTDEKLNDFEQVLKTLLAELFDPSIPFTQTTESDNCRFCQFMEMCNRVGTRH